MIEVRNLDKIYEVNDKKISILNNINFDLPNNGLFFILGRSGSGKSTLLNILEGLDKPTKGFVRIDGRKLNEFNEQEKEDFYKNEIGILFQHFNLIEDLSVYENLKIALQIKSIKNHDLIKEYLNKYNLINRKNNFVYELSGGEKQRLALIRSIINKPKIIFADEPTGALDEENSLFLMKELKELSKETLVVIVSHNKELVNQFADGYLKLENKKIELINVNNKDKENIKKEKVKKKAETIFYFSLLKRNFKKNIFKNIFSFLSLVFSIFILISSLTIKEGVSSYIDNIIYTYPNCNYFEISKVYNTAVNDSHLEIVKKELPTKEDVLTLFKDKEVRVLDNLSYFLNGANVLLEDREIESISFYPTNKVSLNEIIVNQAFIDKYLKDESLNYQEVRIKTNKTYEKYIKEAKENIEEEISFESSFYIKEVSEEFEYLSSPTIYYNYDYFLDLLSSFKAENISLISERYYTYLSLLKDAKNNEDITGFSYLIELQNNDDYAYIKSLIDGEYLEELDLEITSNPYVILDSFTSLADTLFLSLNIFIVLILLTSIFIVAAISFFNFLEHKKENAILKILGSNFLSICSTNIFEQVSLFIFSFLVSVVLFFLSSSLITSLIYKYLNIDINLIINLKLVGIIFLILLVVILLVSYLPLRMNKNIEIVKELKEE